MQFVHHSTAELQYKVQKVLNKCQLTLYTECPPAPDLTHWCVTVTLPPHKDDTKHMSVYWTGCGSTFDCQHSTQEGGRLEDSTRLQQKGVQLSARRPHYDMCSWQVPLYGVV